MAGLLSGLGKLGLKNLEDMDLYEAEKKPEEATAASKPAAPVVQETDFLSDDISCNILAVGAGNGRGG